MRDDGGHRHKGMGYLAWTNGILQTTHFMMIQKALLIVLGSTSLFLSGTSCSNRVEAPGETNVNPPVQEQYRDPGNILERGTIRTAGGQ